MVRPGSLLVSATELTEPSFRRTVVYIVEHNDAGSLGVVINRPSDTAVQDVLPRWAELAASPRALYVGGPVKREAALCLTTVKVGTAIDRVDGLRRVDGRVALLDLDSDPDEIAPLVEGIRIFAGYAGWTFGQLQGRARARRLDRVVGAAVRPDRAADGPVGTGPAPPAPAAVAAGDTSHRTRAQLTA